MNRVIKGLVCVIGLAIVSTVVMESAYFVRNPAVWKTDQYHASTQLPLNFYQDPDRFTNVYSTCIRDADCRILYLHYSKTGGTSIEEQMFSIFPPSQNSCCNSDMVNKFNKNATSYCMRRFSSYQVQVQDFVNTIVPTCVKMTQSRRTIVLVTFREPIERFLSQINQLCNKNPQFRSERVLQICRNCSYVKDTAYWDEFASQHDAFYRALTSLREVSNIAQVLTVDAKDLSSLNARLDKLFPTGGFGKSPKANVEETSVCDFGLTSNMIRRIRGSSEVYGNLKMGGWGQ